MSCSWVSLFSADIAETGIKGPQPHPSFLSSLCLPYKVQSPGSSLTDTLPSSLAVVELTRSGGGLPTGRRAH